MSQLQKLTKLQHKLERRLDSVDEERDEILTQLKQVKKDIKKIKPTS